MGDGVWVAIGHGTSVVCGIASIRIFTELAAPQVIGGGGLLIGLTMLGMQGLVAPITQTQVRFHSGDRDRGCGDGYTREIMRLAMMAALGVMIAIAVSLVGWSLATGAATGTLIVPAIVWIATQACRNVLINRIHAERQQRRYAIWLGTEAVGTLALTTGALLISPTIESYVIGQALGASVGVLAFGRLPRRGNDQNRVDSARIRMTIWQYGLPFSLVAMLGWVSTQADRLILGAQLDAGVVGQYIAAFSIACRLPALPGALLHDVMRPALFEAESRGEKLQAGRLYAAWLLTFAVVAVSVTGALAVMSHLIVDVLLAENYRVGASTIMLWVAAGYSFLGLAQIVECRILSIGTSRPLVSAKLIGAATTVAIAVVMVPMSGAVGAAQASAAGHVMQGVALFLIWRRLRHENGL